MKKFFHVLTIVLLVSSSILTGAWSASAKEQKGADLVIKNASIYKVDGENNIEEAFAVKDGLIVYVGNDQGVEAFISSNTKVMDLEGKMVSPGYIDGHLHSYLMAESIFWLDLSKYSTFKDYETAIKNFLEEHPNLVQFRASGWNEAVTQTASKDLGLTHREMIDKLVSDIPFVAISGGHHEIWANSKAIENAGVNANTPNPSGGNIDRDSLTGEPTGIFREFSAQDLVIQTLPQPDFTVEEYKEATLIFQEKAAENGLTGAFVPIHYSTNSLLEAFKELDNEDKLTLNYELGVWTDSNRGPEQVADLIKVRDEYHGKNYNISTVKIFATGDTHDENIDATGDTGLVWDQANLNATVAELDRAGFTVHGHANGDGQGVKAMIEAIEYAKQQNGKTNLRHAITHIPIVTEDDIDQFKKLDIIPVPQPAWFFRSKGLVAGDPRLPNLNRMKSYFDAGLPVASSSDFPVIDFNPLRGVEGGITRLLPNEDDLSKTLWPAESVTLEQMLTSYTINAAYQIKAEDKTGSIEVGKQADFVVYEDNLFDIPVTQISETKILMTFFKGEELYRHASMVDGSSLSELATQLYNDGHFKNNGIFQSVKAHAQTIERFEAKEDAKNIVKHIAILQKLLVVQKQKALISEEGFNNLYAASNQILKNWQ